jgi:hypothetical protein
MPSIQQLNLYDVIKINQDKTSTMRCKATADLEIKGSGGENQNVEICAAAKCKSKKTNCKMIKYFIQVDKKITTNQSKIMHAINSTTEFAGKITICVLNKTFLLKIAHNM